MLLTTNTDIMLCFCVVFTLIHIVTKRTLDPRVKALFRNRTSVVTRLWSRNPGAKCTDHVFVQLIFGDLGYEYLQWRGASYEFCSRRHICEYAGALRCFWKYSIHLNLQLWNSYQHDESQVLFTDIFIWSTITMK